MASSRLEIKSLNKSMDIKITSVASDETIGPLNQFFTKLEDALNGYFRDKVYVGIDLFIIVIVSVDEDEENNLKWGKKHNASGSFINPFSKERTKYFSVAVHYPVEAVLQQDESQLRIGLCDAIAARLASTEVKVPKGFDLQHFVSEASMALEIYKSAH